MIFVKIIIFVTSLIIGIFFLTKTEKIVFNIGHNNIAEKYLGPGGSYTMWRIIGIILIFIGFLFLVGRLDGFLGMS